MLGSAGSMMTVPLLVHSCTSRLLPGLQEEAFRSAEPDVREQLRDRFRSNQETGALLDMKSSSASGYSGLGRIWGWGSEGCMSAC